MSNDIIVSNNYYKELREDDIRKHYLKYKEYILKEINKRPLVLFLAPTTNHLIVRRNIDGQTIILTDKNYEQILHGRVLSIAVEVGSITDMWFVDIDPGSRVKKQELLSVVKVVVDSFLEKYQIGEAIWKYPRVLNTSTGFHIEMRMKSRSNTKKIQEEIKNYLEKIFKNYDNILINKRKNSENQISLDLTSLNKRGSRVVPYALNRNGLMCMDITKVWPKFKFSDAKIK